MEHLAQAEKIIAIIGAIVVGVTASIALKADWHHSHLDDQVTKILLALMAFGCILVLLAGFGVLPAGTGTTIHPGVNT